ncbi:MAG: recombinase family protein [Micavibrio sp.]|nr:MAG: recombinase family protein [Micavibrio sp.]
MKIGYARVSTEEQNLDLQHGALNAAGCEKLFEDHGISGSATERPGLAEALNTLSEGDTLIVWKLDRLGRSLSHLVGLLDDLGKRRIGFVSLTENIDTTTAGGRLVFHMMAALSEFERSLIVERTKAGMAAARRRGKTPGRPKKLTPERLEHARALLADGKHTKRAAAQLLGVNESTLRRALR